MSLDPEIVNDIAVELGIDAAFVEKDWYSIQVLKRVAAIENEAVTAIFSGGTSLSKGHGLLQRFSEDLDFRALYNFEEADRRNKPTRRAFRNNVIDGLRDTHGVSYNEAALDAGSNYFKFPLAYERGFGENDALRPELKIEFSFTQPRLDPVVRPVSSFVAAYTEQEAEAQILCLSPLETAADKLSALTWRVLRRDRAAADDDPAMIRHLHDLCALRAVIDNENGLFVRTALEAFEEDQQSGRRETDQDFADSLQSALETLRGDEEYQAEYTRFVDAMSYADEGDRISFQDALSHLEELETRF